MAAPNQDNNIVGVNVSAGLSRAWFFKIVVVQIACRVSSLKYDLKMSSLDEADERPLEDDTNESAGVKGVREESRTTLVHSRSGG